MPRGIPKFKEDKPKQNNEHSARITVDAWQNVYVRGLKVDLRDEGTRKELERIINGE